MADSDAHLQDPARLARWKRRALDKGLEVARKLEKLMNGLDVRLDDLGPGMPRNEALQKIPQVRRYLEQIDRVVKSFAHGTFGRCRGCGAAIDEARLEEAPWQDRCAACWERALRDGIL